MAPSTAMALKKLMMATVSQGSARRSFTNYKKDKSLREVSVGGQNRFADRLFTARST